MGLLLLWVDSASAEQPAATPAPSLRVRLEWGGGQRRVWTGELHLSEGRLLDPVALGIEADTPGTLRIEQNRLLVHHRTSRAYAGLDVTLEAPLDATLTIDLRAADENAAVATRQRQPAAQSVEIPLRGLLRGQTERALDTEGNKLLVYRLAGDQLRLEVDHPHMIFEPGETLSARLTVPLLDALTREASVQWELRPARKTDRLAHAELGRLEPGQAGPVQFPLSVELPKEEGVYDLHLAVVSQGRLRQVRLYERQVQLVVLAAAAAPNSADARSQAEPLEDAPRVVDEIDPTKEMGWAAALDPVPRILAGRTLRARQLPPPQIRKTSLGTFVEMRRRATDPAESWIGYWLRIKHPGRPHLVVVEYPEDQQQSLGISIVEPNSANRVWPVGFDSGLYTGGPAGLRDAVGRHELLFWPRTSSPLLLLTNLRTDAPAAFGRIRILELHNAASPDAAAATQAHGLRAVWRRATSQTMPSVGLSIADAQSDAAGVPVVGSTFQARPQSPDETPEAQREPPPAHQTAAAAVPPSAPHPSAASAEAEGRPRPATAPTQRLFGPYMDKPLFPENFGASEQLERSSNRSLDDWLTFWQGAHRLVDYLKRQGYNSMVLAVLADGSTIYPSRLLEPTPRYDMGVFFPDGRDPMRKDVLELLFRLFDREGLVLVPELQFNAPLPELERMLATEPPGSDRTGGIRLVGADGRDWLDRFGSYRGLAPYYNPLNPHVQDEMLRVVGELAQRYEHHGSFGGLAMQLSADGYAQFPGLDWGYDDETIARFAAESHIPLPEPDGRADRTAQYHQVLTQQARKEWLSWRARMLADLYRRVAQRVSQSQAGARFYLTTTHALAGNLGARAVYSALQEGRGVEELLLERGIDRQMISGNNQIVWLRPSRVGTLEHLRGGALDADISNSPELDALFRSSLVPGALFFHRPYTQRLPLFEKANLPWKDTYMQLVAQLSPSGVDNRRRFAHALAGMDAQVLWDGGWLIPMGQEPALKGWIDAFRRLPPVAFAPVEPEDATTSTQPVTVRRYAGPERTYLYLVNDSAWTVSAGLSLHCPLDTPLEQAGADYSLSLRPTERGVTRLECELGAYGLCVAELPVQNLKVSNLVVDVPGAVRSALEEEIASLYRRSNEIPDDNESQRLAASLHNAGFEQAQPDEPALPQDWTFNAVDRSGRAALDANRPYEGQSSLRCSSRGTLTSAPFAPPPRPFLGLRVRLRSDREGVRVRLALEGTMAQGKYTRPSVPILVGRNWQPYMFRIFDLPHDQIRELRAQLELVQDATVWVDAVELVSFPLKEKEANELGKTVTNARSALDMGKLSDCRRILDSYWARFIKEQLPDPQQGDPSTAVLTGNKQPLP